MSPRADANFQLVIFDCDGVLVDSEGPSCRLIARSARAAGIALSDARAMEFAGRALSDIKHVLDAESGTRLADDWVAQMQQALVELMREEAEPIDGVHAMLASVAALGFPVRVGSNSSSVEMEAKFGRVGLTEHFRDRIHSARDMRAPKPSPVVYLEAARAENIAPERCIVLEDTDTGAKAAHAAGMTCVLLRSQPLPLPPWDRVHRIEHLSEFAPLLERLEILTDPLA
jgi:HAD superfamily hydrolase (TIGR01509 family)